MELVGAEELVIEKLRSISSEKSAELIVKIYDGDITEIKYAISVRPEKKLHNNAK